MIALAIIMMLSISAFSQQDNKPNKYYKSVVAAQSLDAVIPVDDIQSITVTNYSGTHTLTKKELTVLKKQLKQAKFAVGLLVKPGHVTLSIKLQTNSKAKTGYVYAYEGMVNFDEGVDKSGKRFTGTYYLPSSINFDNYKQR
jgi:hypothetical protein